MNRNELLKKREEKLDEIEELKAEVKELELEINSLGNKYESIMIFNANTSEEKMQEKGYYYLIRFEGNEEKVKNLERYYRIKDEIMKFVTVKMEEF